MIYSICLYSAATALAVLFSRKYTLLRATGSVGDPDVRSSGRAFMILSFLPLYLLSALRWNTGTDTYHTYTPQYYGMIWKITGHMSGQQTKFVLDSWKHLIEKPGNIHGIHGIRQYYASESVHTSPLFRLLEYPLVHLDADVQWLYIITSAVILALVFVAIYRQSVDAPLAVFFFVVTSSYFLSLNIVSQYIAIAICLVACEFAEKNRPAAFFALVAVAIGFHTSAFVFLPVYFLNKIRLRPRWCFGIVALCLISSPVLFRVIESVVRTAAPKYQRYLSADSSFELVFFAIGMFVMVLGTLYFDKCKDMKYFRLWYYMNVLGLMALCFSGQIPYMKRINYYYSAPLFMMLPCIICAEDDVKKRRILKWGLIAVFVLETVVAVVLLNKNEVMPYTFCWQRSLGIRPAAPLV